MDSRPIVVLSVEELRTIIREAVREGIEEASLNLERPRIRQLPEELTRQEVMDLLQIKATKAAELFKLPGFPVRREGKSLYVNTKQLFKWMDENTPALKKQNK